MWLILVMFTRITDKTKKGKKEMKKDYDIVKALFDKLPEDDQKNLINEASHQFDVNATHLPTIEEQDGNRTTRWDLFSRLLSERIIRLDGEVNGAMASVVQASLQYLNSQNKEEPIHMIINSPGGSVLDGLAIYDTMREIDAPVHTRGYGLMASMGSLLLVAGDKRFASKNSSIMIHQVSAGTRGTFHDMEVGHENTERLYKQLVDIYVAHTGVEEEYWYDQLLDHDNWLSPKEAQKISLIDEIIPHKKPAPYEHMVNEDAEPKRKKFNEEAKKTIEEIYKKRLAREASNDDTEVAPANSSNSNVAKPKTPKSGM